MKRLIFLFAIAFALFSIVKAQTPPNAFNYSAVARNTDGQPIAIKTISIQISILKTSLTGEPKYIENHRVTTDPYGLFNLIIGKGSIQSGSITTIDWSNDNYYVKVGMDINGGNNFLTMGTTQLLSVPYALYAKSAGNIVSNNLILPTVITKEVINITSNSATFGGEVINTNGNQIIEHGIVYSTSSNPTIISKKLVIVNGLGSFDTTTSMKYTDPHFLKANTKYFVRAYVVTENGICLYGNEVVFTTTIFASPILATYSVDSITSNSASFKGEITNSNGNVVIESGIVVSLESNPIYGASIKLGNGPREKGLINCSIDIYAEELTEFLVPNSKYYARSYAVTENNYVTYGNELSFFTLNVGQIGPSGGLVFFNKGNTAGGWQYLEVANKNQSDEIAWGCENMIIEGTKRSIGSGLPNTKKIVQNCKEDINAAQLIDELVSGGKNDWFLPSFNELYLMYKNLHVIGKGNFNVAGTRFIPNLPYWSSTDINLNYSYYLDFYDGIWSMNTWGKGEKFSVRAIRAY
jgi:hypothetical protein